MHKNGISMSLAEDFWRKLSAGSTLPTKSICFHHINKICTHIISYIL